MAIEEHYTATPATLNAFLSEHEGQAMQIFFDHRLQVYHIVTRRETTEATFNMEVLHSMFDHYDLTMEEQNSIDYGISAIKTLLDMEIIK